VLKYANLMKEEIGKVLIDIAKLVIGGVILAGLMRQDIEPVLLFTVGSVISILFITLGLNLISSEKKKKTKNRNKR